MSNANDAKAKREALAKAAVRAAWPGAIDPWPQAVPQGCWLRVADFILARQAEREGPLVEALERVATAGRYEVSQTIEQLASAVLARYRALDPPPQRTLAEVAADVAALRERFVLEADRVRPLLDELADALERANASDKPKASAREKGAK